MHNRDDALDRLIDIGANLTHDSFDHDRDAVIDAAREAGVARMVVTGADVAGSTAAARLAAERPRVLYATAGVHPHYSKSFDEHTIPALRALCAQDSVVAVGECGLDHFRNFSTPAQQDAAFEAQLELAVETRLPVFLHQRDAHDRFVEILSQYRPRLTRAVAHCFTGTDEELADCLDLDLYVGITGWICDERRGLHLREVVTQVPPDRLMIETDAPYLLPRDLKPKPKSRRNEPKNLRHVLDTVAACLDRPVDEIARLTTANAVQFFDLPSPAHADAGQAIAEERS